MESGPKKILIIEDEKPLARALELKLTHEGFLVTNIPNGELALPLLEKESFLLKSVVDNIRFIFFYKLT